MSKDKNKRTRHYRTLSVKADLLRKHHVDKVPISDLCDQKPLQPSVFYSWQRHLWDHSSMVFTEAKPSFREQELEAQGAALRAKLAKKEHVIAKLSEELIEAKKQHGAP